MEEIADTTSPMTQRRDLLQPLAKVTLAATLCGCGPQAAETGSSGSGDGTSSQSGGTSTGLAATSSSSSEVADESTTGIVPGCGNGVLEEAEWCFERHSVSTVEDHGEPYRVISGGEREPGFSLWARNGFYLVHWDREQLSFQTDPYYGIGAYHFPDSVVYRAKLILAGEGRVDLLHYSPLNSFCNIVSGPLREPNGDPGGPVHYLLLNLDCSRGNLLFPIRLAGLELDAFFLSEPFYERSTLFHFEFPPEDFFAPGMGGTEALQWMEARPPCGIRLGHAANIRGDSQEEAVLLADECADDGEYGLFAHTPDGDLSLSDAAVRLGGVSLPAPPLSWMVLPPANDGEHERFVVAGTGYTTLLFFEDGEAPAALDLHIEAVPLQFSHEDGPLERLPLSHGVFAADGSNAVAVNTDDGIRIVALDGTPLGLFEEEAQSYAVSDLNGDGWADLAALVDGQVVVHLSNP